MPRFISVLNHDLTVEQLEEIHQRLGCDDVITLPGDLKEVWSQVPAAGPLNAEGLSGIVTFLRSVSRKGDYLLVQGDFGATWYIVEFGFSLGLVPVYSTSKRRYSEQSVSGGFIAREHLYKHVAFRRYIRWTEQEGVL